MELIQAAKTLKSSLENFVEKLEDFVESEPLESSQDNNKSVGVKLSRFPSEFDQLQAPFYPSSGRPPQKVLEKFGFHFGDTVEALVDLEVGDHKIPTEENIGLVSRFDDQFVYFETSYYIGEKQFAAEIGLPPHQLKKLFPAHKLH